jgi:exodeoxyribonuclease V alpha subunit
VGNGVGRDDGESGIVATLRSMRDDGGVSVSRFHPDAEAVLDALLPPVVDGAPNLQRSAADVAGSGRLSVVVGGPGTGKTYTVARLLAALATDARRRDETLRVALAAPTGKAAARLQESIAATLGDEGVRARLDPEVLADLGDVVPTTIHRLLGSRMPEHRHRFRHDADRPLPYDVVVVDETSMVSAPLLARLLEAIPPTARLVLLGDPDQLESVELGAVLADLVRSVGPGSPLDGRVVRLERGHRFGGGSAIARLADAVRRGEFDAVLDVLRSGDASVEWIETADPVGAQPLERVRTILEPSLRAVREAAEVGDAAVAYVASVQARILCAHRLGPFGVATWNSWGERWLRDAASPTSRRPGGGGWYPGRLLLATRNDPRLRLANGDTGVVVRSGDRLVAAFVTGGGLVTLDPVQLADVETAFATTVHKSQGSEYPAVVIPLTTQHYPMLQRNLVYMGVTRGKRLVVLVGQRKALSIAVRGQQTRRRWSKLKERLAPPTP